MTSAPVAGDGRDNKSNLPVVRLDVDAQQLEGDTTRRPHESPTNCQWLHTSYQQQTARTAMPGGPLLLSESSE